MDPLTRCARIPVDLTMSGGSEAMKMFHVSFFFCVVLRGAAPPQGAPPRARRAACAALRADIFSDSGRMVWSHSKIVNLW